MNRPFKTAVLLAALSTAYVAPIVLADAPATAPVTADNAADRAQQMIDSGLAFLKTQQKPDGGFAPDKLPPAITALALRTFVQTPTYSTKDDFVKKGYDKLLTFQTPEGGIFKDYLANYNTAIAISSLAAANDPALKPQLDKAVAYLRSLQWNDKSVGPKGETIKDGQHNNFEGGFGYNIESRPDLSNEHFALEALKEAGVKPDDPAYAAALKFVSRCQNFSETNDQSWAGNDGGFVYSPANGGDSEAESYVGPDGRKMWRSYGTMTYAGLKSMIYAGVSKDDPRVKACIGWIQKHWSLTENPGLADNDPKQAADGIFYYYNVMAKALAAYGEPIITDDSGKAHDWRIEMINSLAQRQKPNGAWIGDQRWMENMPVLATSYSLLALEEAQHDLKVHPAK